MSRTVSLLVIGFVVGFIAAIALAAIGNGNQKSVICFPWPIGCVWTGPGG